MPPPPPPPCQFSRFFQLQCTLNRPLKSWIFFCGFAVPSPGTSRCGAAERSGVFDACKIEMHANLNNRKRLNGTLSPANVAAFVGKREATCAQQIQATYAAAEFRHLSPERPDRRRHNNRRDDVQPDAPSRRHQDPKQHRPTPNRKVERSRQRPPCSPTAAGRTKKSARSGHDRRRGRTAQIKEFFGCGRNWGQCYNMAANHTFEKTFKQNTIAVAKVEQ